MANDCIPIYRPGEDVTGRASAAITGKRFLKISGNRTSGPGLSATAEGGLYQVAPCDAASHPVGVAKYDAASGKNVGIISTGVVPVTCGATITAGQAVQSDATGQAIPLAAGVKAGVAMSAGVTASDVEIKLTIG